MTTISLWFFIVFSLFYFRASSYVWAISSVIAYSLTIKYVGFGIAGLIITILAVVLLPIYIPFVRYKIISIFFQKFSDQLPKISKTEQEAINAGDCGWEKNLLIGSPSWKDLHTGKKHTLTTDEQKFIEGPVAELLDMSDDWDITYKKATIDDEIWDFMKQNGFFGIIIPKEYGGLGFSSWGLSRVFLTLYTKSVTVATTVSVPNSLGPAELLMHYGTTEQKKYYLPRLASGKEIPCFALTSQEAGSDASSMQDFGIVTHGEFEGKRVLGIKLNWNKRYITLAPVATLLGLAFKLYDPDSLIGDTTDIGITCALIPTDLSGVTTGRRHMALNTPFQNGPTSGKDVFIPMNYVIGGMEMVGKGWKMLMECLATGRAISLPSSAVGESQQILLATSSYVVAREQFNLPIGYFEGIQEPLARIAAKTYMIDALFHFTVGIIQDGVKASVASAITKYHATELAREIINDAMDIHGGKGICIGPRNYLFSAYQSTPISITVEGSNILTRSLIIYGQGLIRSHPYVLDELDAIANNEVKKLDRLLCKHLSHGLYNFCRAFVYSITCGYFIRPPRVRLSTYYKRLSRYCIYLALLSDLILLIYRANFKRKESLSGRLGDVLSYAYLGSAILKKYKEDGELPKELPLVTWSMDYICFKIERSLKAVIDNLPTFWLRFGLKLLIFPYGRQAKYPTDKLNTKVSQLFLEPGIAREKATRFAYTKDNFNGTIAGLNALFFKLHDAKDIYKKLRLAKKSKKIRQTITLKQFDEALALKVITKQEHAVLTEIEALRSEVIAVDDFDFDAFTRTN